MYKNLLKNTLLVATFALFTTASNAALISHDLLFDDATTTEVSYESIGSITVDSDKADDWGIISSWESFSFLGWDVITEAQAGADFTLFGLFEAEVDKDNLSAGLNFLTFDVTEGDSDFFNFQGIYDADTINSANNFIDVFDFSGTPYLYGDFALSSASVVSEPSMFFLFFSGLVAVFIKRRKV